MRCAGSCVAAEVDYRKATGADSCSNCLLPKPVGGFGRGDSQITGQIGQTCTGLANTLDLDSAMFTILHGLSRQKIAAVTADTGDAVCFINWFVIGC